MKKIIALLVVLSGMFIAGCFSENLWPTARDQAAVKYADPNSGKVGGIAMLGTVKQDKTNVDLKHISVQQDLQKKMNVDNQTYAIISNTVNSNIKDAQASYNAIIGTLEQPGWLLTLGLSILSGYGINVYKNNTMYSQTEYDAKKTDTNTVVNS